MNERLLLIMAKNDVNPPIHNDPMEKRNKFIHHTSYLPLALPQGMDLGSGVTEWKPPSRVPMVQIWMLSDEWLSRYELLKNLNLKNFNAVWRERGRPGRLQKLSLYFVQAS